MHHTWCFTPLHALAKIPWPAILVRQHCKALLSRALHSTPSPRRHLPRILASTSGQSGDTFGTKLVLSCTPGDQAAPAADAAPAASHTSPSAPQTTGHLQIMGAAADTQQSLIFSKACLSSPQLGCFSHSLGHSWCGWKEKGTWTWLWSTDWGCKYQSLSSTLRSPFLIPPQKHVSTYRRGILGFTQPGHRGLELPDEVVSPIAVVVVAHHLGWKEHNQPQEQQPPPARAAGVPSFSCWRPQMRNFCCFGVC